MALSRTIVIFLVALTAGLWFRVRQFPYIDFETGFFRDGYSPAQAGGFYIVAAALLVALAAYLIFVPEPDHGGMTSPGLFDFISGDIAQTVLTLIAAFAYGVIGFTLAVRRKPRPAAGAAMVLLALYYTAGAASVFNKHLVLKEMSNPLVILLTNICAVLFFFGIGRIFARTESRSTRNAAVTFGFLTALLSVTECTAFWLFLRTADADTVAVLTGERIIDGINPQIDIPPVTLIIQGLTVVMLLLLLCSRKNGGKKTY